MGRWKWAVLALLTVELVGGCASVFHDLKPHRLRRLNRGPAPALDPEFSAVTHPAESIVLANSGQPVTVRAQQ